MRTSINLDVVDRCNVFKLFLLTLTNLESSNLIDILSDVVEVNGGTAFLVAYSGGVDSSVLLHMLHSAKPTYSFSLTALHIDHGIHPQSGSWLEHCAEFCHSLGINFKSTQLSLSQQSEKISEDDARIARYAWLETQTEKGDVILTAHHQNDQAETFLLNLMRGSGARGLSAIQVSRNFGKGLLVRPMLNISRSQILEYAAEHELSYIEDPANSDLQHNRNYMRQVVIPSLEQRWPSAVELISHSAALLVKSRNLQASLAQIDAESCKSEGTGFLSIGYQLSLRKFRLLDEARQVNLIRYWTKFHSLPEPGQQIIENFLDKVISRCSKFMEVGSDELGYRIYLYQNNLYLARARCYPNADQSISWNLRDTLSLESLGLKLIPIHSVGEGLSFNRVMENLSIRFRTGGEKIRLPKRNHSTSLKKLYQEYSIPPWERKVLPLVYCGDELAAIASWMVSERFQAKESEHSIYFALEQIPVAKCAEGAA